jgi:hypothetical protein
MFGGDLSDNEQADDAQAAEPQEAEVVEEEQHIEDVSRISVPCARPQVEGDVYLMKLPNFLSIDPR